MLRGYLDGIASSGYIEGWAYNTESPLDPMTIAVLDEDKREVAWGLAHRFREDLAAAGCATGWCAFRVKAMVSITTLRGHALTLIERVSGGEISRIFPVPYTEDLDPKLGTVADVVALDPTTIRSITQLKGCEEVFGQFVSTRGVEAFIRAAYVYVLSRPADASGLASYGDLLKKSALTPLQVLTTLTDCDEFRSRSRLLAAPITSAFPFR